MKSWRDRIPCCVLTGLLVGACGSASAQQPRATLDRYCTGCHNSTLKTGGLALDDAAAGEPAAHPEIWEKVVRKLRVRYMPPAGLPRPDERTYERTDLRARNLARPAPPPRIPIPAGPTPSAASTAPNIRTPSATCWRSTSMSPRCCPSDDSSHGFDNVTVGDLSPTLLERYLSAARKISRLAVGSPARSPGGDTVTLPPDLTQEEHFDELPLGTRGGLVVPLHVPARRRVRNPGAPGARPQRARGRPDRNPTQVELMLDGERVGLFTVKPPAAGNDHHAGRSRTSTCASR